MPANNTLNYYLTLLKEMFLMFNPSEEEKSTQDDKLDNEKQNSKDSGHEVDADTLEELQVQKSLVVYLMVNINILRMVNS